MFSSSSKKEEENGLILTPAPYYQNFWMPLFNRSNYFLNEIRITHFIFINIFHFASHTSLYSMPSFLLLIAVVPNRHTMFHLTRKGMIKIANFQELISFFLLQCLQETLSFTLLSNWCCLSLSNIILFTLFLVRIVTFRQISDFFKILKFLLTPQKSFVHLLHTKSKIFTFFKFFCLIFFIWL